MCSSNSYGYGDNGESLSLHSVLTIVTATLNVNSPEVRSKVGTDYFILTLQLIMCKKLQNELFENKYVGTLT